jgi:hypothetical protein
MTKQELLFKFRDRPDIAGRNARNLVEVAKMTIGDQNARIESNQTRCETPSAKSQQIVRHESVATAERKANNTARYLVRIDSRRKRLIDPDNLCAKYMLDAIKYAGCIPDDRPQDIQFQIGQTKVETEEECTVIEIIPL